MISKILVANRGEIARRIFRTAHKMGIATVAIHSEPDTHEPHTREAGESHALIGATPSDTYLNIDAILTAAKETGADAIHPGYGFLAENHEFGRAVIGAGITWIGPSPDAMEVMGSKLASKRLMENAGVPILPSVDLEGLTSVGSAAMSFGYPIVVKASAGGGGKGMRIVTDPNRLADSIESARREAEAAFGDGTVFIEKYLTAPRHIEIQVFGDTRGKVVSLFERECSIQRRHQKIIEEAPSPVIDQKTRSAMGRAAVEAARSVDYVGAGTVEFLYQDGRFFFLEMNTRLQVEHPVTEMVTGLDLVRLQIEVADGIALPDAEFSINGHAIEARLYSEDPLNGFLPVTGTFRRFEFPHLDGLRVDAGIESGSTVSVHYDPMIAKVIAHGPTRQAAAATLAGALRGSRIHGSTTNLELLVRVLESDEFLAGNTDTGFLERNDIAFLSRPLLDQTEESLAAAAVAVADQADERKKATVLATVPSGWRNLRVQGQHRSFVGPAGVHNVAYDMEHAVATVDTLKVAVTDVTPEGAGVELGHASHQFEVARYGPIRYVDSGLGTVRLEVVPRFPSKDLDEDVGSLHAPMPGRVIRVEAVAGALVSEGDVLIVMEAMKMEHTLRAPHTGTVAQVLCEPNDQVEADAILVVIAES